MKHAEDIRFHHMRKEAEGYFELGMYSHALNVLQKIDYRVQKRDIGTLFLQGECLRILNRHHEARRVLEEVAAMSPGSVFVLVSLAWSQKRSGRIDLACESIREALSYEPESPLLHFNISCYYSLLGEKKKSLDHLTRALLLDPTFHELILEESDFDPMRNEPEFLSIVNQPV